MSLWIDEFLKHLETDEKPSIWLEEERVKKTLDKNFPELLKCFGIKQNKYHKYDVYYHLLYACDATPKRLELRLAALLHDIGKPFCKKTVSSEVVFYNHEIVSTDIAFKLLKKWNIKHSLVKKITLLIRYHMFHYQDEWTDSAVRRIMKKVGRDNIEDLFLLRVADREGNGYRSGEPAKVGDFRTHMRKIIEEEKRFKVTDLQIGGEDLIKLGMKPGKEMGNILKELCERVLKKGLKNEKELLLNEAEKILNLTSLKK